MNPWVTCLIGAAVVAALALLIYLWFGVYMAKQKNAYCRTRIGRQAESMARRWGHIYLRGVRLPFEGGSVKIDHMVIGTFGVVLLNGYDGHGSLYGSRGDQGWYLYDKDNKQKKTLTNPMTRMENGIAAMRKIFAESGVYHVTDVDAFLVFGNGVDLNVSLSGKEPVQVFSLKKFGRELRRSKYQMEGKVNPEKAVEALRRAADSIQ